MSYIVLNVIAVIAIAFAALGDILGFLAPANAFFAAIFGLTLYTGSQLDWRSSMHFVDAAKSMIFDSSTYPTKKAGHFAYLASVASAFGVVGHVVLTF